MGTVHHFPWEGPEEIKSSIKPKNAGYKLQQTKRKEKCPSYNFSTKQQWQEQQSSSQN